MCCELEVIFIQNIIKAHQEHYKRLICSLCLLCWMVHYYSYISCSMVHSHITRSYLHSLQLSHSLSLPVSDQSQWPFAACSSDVSTCSSHSKLFIHVLSQVTQSRITQAFAHYSHNLHCFVSSESPCPIVKPCQFQLYQRGTCLRRIRDL